MSDKLYGGNLDPISLEDYLIIDKTKEINLLDIYNEICREEADAHLDISGEEPRIVPHVTGISFNLSKAESMLAEVLNNGGDKLVIPLVLTEPEITTEEFEELLFRDVLAEAKTTLNARNTNRTGNVKLSANTINGVILNPGDIFSYNDTVGERTYEKGYKDASAYTSSGIEDQLGGGICQTSSTLYMTVIRAGLEIIERYNHAYTVVYAPLGEDATIYWGSLDFKFANNRKFPIKIEAYQEKDYVVVRLLGTKTDNNRVEISTVVLSHTPYETFTVENPNLDYGVRRQKVEGHSAYHVETYRIVYDENGKEISREKLPNSRYKRLDRVIEVGTKGAPEETVSPIETDGPSAPPSDPPSASPSVPPTTSPTTHPSDQPTVPPTAYPSDPPQDPSPPADTATPSPAVSPSVSPPEPTPASTSEPDSP
jgi:vancomycin resistance protein YoaR